MRAVKNLLMTLLILPLSVATAFADHIAAKPGVSGDWDDSSVWEDDSRIPTEEDTPMLDKNVNLTLKGVSIVSNLYLQIGTLTIVRGGSLTTTFDDGMTHVGDFGHFILNIDGGKLVFGDKVVYIGIDSSSGNYVGSGEINIINGGIVESPARIVAGSGLKGRAVVTVDGSGSTLRGTNLELDGADSELIVRNGGEVELSDRLQLQALSSILTLKSGGVLKTARVMLPDPYQNPALHINGGTIVATEDNDTFFYVGNDINSPHPLAIPLEGRLTFDTDGHDVGVQGFSDQSGFVGKLAKTGAGTLTLHGANSFTGATEVREGALSIDDAAASLASKRLVMYAGTIFRRGLGAHSLANGSLAVYGGDASYVGDLDAHGARLDFFVPAGKTISAIPTMLTVSGTANIDGAVVNLGFAGDAPHLKPGDSIELIDAAALNGKPANTAVQGRALRGVTLAQDLLVEETNDRLFATVAEEHATEQSKSLSEGFLASAVQLRQAQDFAADAGMSAALESAQGDGKHAFGAVSASNMRYNTGSHVDVDGASVIVGLDGATSVAGGKLVAGGFYEHGDGNYSTTNDFSTGRVRGKGSTRYDGGGLIGHLGFDNGVHVAGGAHAGKAHMDFHSSDLRDSLQRRAGYKSDSEYVGAHASAGKEWALNDAAGIDTYARYVWMRQGADTVKLSTGDTVEFAAVDSRRARLGTRFDYRAAKHASLYTGAGIEREFGGAAHATTAGKRIESPSMKGNSRMVEVGAKFSDVEKLPLSLDVGVQEYEGKRQGITGNLKLDVGF
jgi:outer membrane autotransporter protein